MKQRIFLITSAALTLTFCNSICTGNSAQTNQPFIIDMPVNETALIDEKPLNLKDLPDLQANANLEQPIDKQTLEFIKSAATDLIFKTQALIEGTAQLIGTQIKQINKEDVHTYLLSLKKHLTDIEKTIKKCSKLEEIFICMRLASAIQNSLQAAIRSEFKLLPEPAFENATKRSPNRTVTIEQLGHALQRSEEQLKTIARQAEQAGLSRLNRAYRKIETFLSDHKLFYKAGMAALTAIAITYILVRIPSEYFPNVKGLGWLKKIKKRYLGEAPSYGEIEDPNNPGKRLSGVRNSEDLKFVGKFQEVFGHALPVLDFTIAGPAVVMIGAKLFKEPLKEMLTAAYSKINEVRAWLGGTSTIRKYSALSDGSGEQISFDDVVGCENAKAVLQDVIEFMKEPESYARRHIDPDRGILFYGAPRTGKSMLARALQTEIKKQLPPEDGNDFRCILVDSSKIGPNDDYQFKLADILRELAHLDKAAVIVIDEMDLIGLSRESSFAQKHAHLGQMLSFMSGLIANSKVIVIGITNIPEALDIALLQPGRFGRHIEFTTPNAAERKIFWQRQLKKNAVVFNESTIDRFVKETETATLEDINFAMSRALRSAKASEKPLREMDVYKALDEVIHGIRFESVPVAEDVKAMIADYLSGQAVAAYLLNGNLSVAKIALHPITTKPKSHAEETVFAKQYGKLILYKGDNADLFKTGKELEKHLMILLAGEASLSLLEGEKANTYMYGKADIEQAFKLLKAVKARGLSDAILSPSLQEQFTQEAHAELAQIRRSVYELLKPHAEKIRLLRDALIEKPLMQGIEIDELLSELAA